MDNELPFARRTHPDYRAEYLLSIRIEQADEAFAVDVEIVQDVEHIFDIDVPVDGPEDDVEVFFAGTEVIGDAVEQEDFVLEFAFEEAVFFVAQLGPENGALEMLDPAGSQIAVPMTLDPAFDGGLAQVAARSFAFDPLEFAGLASTLGNERHLHGGLSNTTGWRYLPRLAAADGPPACFHALLSYS